MAYCFYFLSFFHIKIFCSLLQRQAFIHIKIFCSLLQRQAFIHDEKRIEMTQEKTDLSTVWLVDNNKTHMSNYSVGPLVPYIVWENSKSSGKNVLMYTGLQIIFQAIGYFTP